MQVGGLAAAAAGFFLLAGWAWLLLVGGVVLLCLGVLVEYSSPRMGWKDGS